MKETQMTSWGYEVHSLGMIGNCFVNAQLPDFKVNNADQALGWTFHNGVKIRAVFPAESSPLQTSLHKVYPKAPALQALAILVKGSVS